MDSAGMGSDDSEEDPASVVCPTLNLGGDPVATMVLRTGCQLSWAAFELPCNFLGLIHSGPNSFGNPFGRPFSQRRLASLLTTDGLLLWHQAPYAVVGSTHR